jgi:ferredoxin-NADP reductase
MASICRHIAAKKIKGDFRLYYFCGKRANAAFLSELMSYAKSGAINGDFRFTKEQVPGFSQERVDINKVIESLGPSFAEYSYYLCGPVAMVKSFSDAIVEKGVDRKKIKSDAFG